MSINPEHFLKTIHTVDKTVADSNWKIFFYQEFSHILMNDNGEMNQDVWDQIAPLLGAGSIDNSVNFRTQLIIRSIPLLIGIYFDRGEIRFYTPKLSQELFLLQQSDILDLDIRQIKELRIHSELAASLQVKNFPTVIETITKVEGLPDLLHDPKYAAVEERSAQIVKKLLGFLNEYRPSLFEDITDFGLGLTAQYALLRIHLLKFLAILPSLDHDKKGVEVKRILIEALSRFLQDNRKARKARKKDKSAHFRVTIRLA